MPQGPDGKTIIIVKKVVGHGGHHGGSWKVAYADFVTSMMAFFMVLWLVNSASVQVRERIASYFRAPGVFEKGSGTPVELGGAGILPDAFAPPAESNSQVQPNDSIYQVGTKDGEKRESFGEGGGDGHLQKGQEDLEKGGYRNVESRSLEEQKSEFEKAAKEIEEMLEKEKGKIAGIIGKIEVSVDQRGLHLEIMDTPYASMFMRGSASVVSSAEAELAKIGDIIKLLPNPVDIEGHTDAAPYRGRIAERYDNWTLSSDRANAARLILKRSGLQDSQIARVVGYSSQRPKNVTDPLEASNRRISISMRYTEQAAASLKSVNAKETSSTPLRKPRPATESKKPTPEPTEEKGSKELRVEVSTTPQEGAPAPEIQEVPTEPAWIQKDLIFGNSNPFISR